MQIHIHALRLYIHSIQQSATLEEDSDEPDQKNSHLRVPTNHPKRWCTQQLPQIWCWSRCIPVLKKPWLGVKTGFLPAGIWMLYRTAKFEPRGNPHT